MIFRATFVSVYAANDEIFRKKNFGWVKWVRDLTQNLTHAKNWSGVDFYFHSDPNENRTDHSRISQTKTFLSVYAAIFHLRRPLFFAVGYVRIVQLLIFVVIMLVLICHLHHDISLLHTMLGVHCTQSTDRYFL